MDITHETDPTDVYDDDLLQLRRNPRRLLACGAAAALAVIAVVVVARGGHEEPVGSKVHTSAPAPAWPTTVPRSETPDTTVPSSEEGGFFSRMFGDRYQGLHDNKPVPGEAATGGGAYSVGPCSFDLDVPEGWDTYEQDGMFVAAGADDMVALTVNCRPYDGTPLKQLADELPTEMPGIGKVQVLKQGALKDGYRLEVRSEDDKHFRVTWIVSGDDIWSLIEVYHQGDGAAASTAHRVSDSFRLTEAS